MCGIVGVVSNAPVNQLIYDALLLLQHRGQDAAGIVTQQERKFFMHKAKGMVKDVFRTRNMRSLPGNCGLGQVRYPTAGNAFSEEEAQPFYVNAPFGIVLVHNGNLTNAHALKAELFNNLYLGFSLRLNYLVSNKRPENFDNLYIPGFNRTYDGKFGAGLNYTISYFIPIYKKNKEVKK